MAFDPSSASLFTESDKGNTSAPSAFDPDSARMVGDGEGVAPPEPKGFTGHVRDLGLSVLQGAIGVPEMAVGLADIPTGGAVGKALENKDGAFGFRPKQAREYLDTLKTDATQQQKKEFEQADGVMGKTAYALQNPSMIANAVAESLPMMGAGGVIGRGVMAAAPKVGAAMAAAAGEGVAAAGSAAEQIRQETADGNLTPTQSGLAVATGAATAGFGALGAKVANRLGIADADTLMVQGAKGLTGQATQQAALKSIPRKVVEGAIAEGFLEELPQSASEQILQNLALGKDWSEGVDSAIVMGTLAGVAMGGGAAGAQGMMQQKPGEALPVAPPSADAAPTLALPAPTYTGTPGDQLLQSDAERANEVMAAEARAAQVYQQRADFEAARQGQSEQNAPNPGLEMLRQAYAEQLRALQGQEQGEPDVPQSAPPDGRAVLEARQAESRAVMGPDDEILQSTGAAEPPHRAMGIDPAAGPLSTGAAIAVDSGVHGQMQAAAQDTQGQPDGPVAGAMPGIADRSQPAQEGSPAARWDSLTAQERAEVAGRAGLPPVIARNLPRAGWATLNPELQARLTSEMGPTDAKIAPKIEGNDLGDGWKAFTPESGTLSVPRAEMPQIKAEHRGAMTNFMNARGVSHAAEEVPADSLRPTQAEFSPAKVRQALGYTGGDRSILVSSDNYVLDGHHQWLAKRQAGEPVKVIRLNAPIRQLIALAHEFPSSTTAGGPSVSNGLGDRGRAAAAADDLRAMAQDAGWAERGGLLIRDAAGNATGRTKWLPRAEWFMAGMEADPETLVRDIDRFAAGERVPAKSLRTIEGMIDWLDAQRGEPRLDEDASAYDFEAAGLGQDASEEAVLIGDIFAEAAPQDEAAVMRALGFTEEEIQDVVGQKADREGPRGTGQDGTGRAQEAGEVARGDAQPQGEAGSEGSPEGLTSYTNEDIARQEAAQRAAAAEAEKAQREADQKAQADAEREAFTLTGSERPADVLATQGQGGLFDAPAAAPTPQAAPAKDDPGTRWDSLTAEQRAAILTQPGGWSTQAGGLNVIGKQLARKGWEQITEGTRGTITRLMEKARNQESIKNESRADAGPAPAAGPANQEAVKKPAGVKEAPPETESYNDGVRREMREARIRRLQEDRTITRANGKPFKTEASARAFSNDNELGNTHEAVPRDGGFVLQKRRRAADPETLRQEAAFARAEKIGPAAEAAVTAYENGDTSIEEFEAALDAVDQPAVGNAPSPVEALFSDLNSGSTRKANKAKKAAAKLPQAARIDYVQANFHDILIQMMEAGALEVNGATTLTEDNAPCL